MHGKTMTMALGLLVVSATGRADDAPIEDPRWYVSPMVTYTMTDSDRDADDGVGGYLGLGKPLTRHINMELYAHGVHVDADDGKQEMQGAGASALLMLSRNPAFSPYIALGASGVRTKYDSDSTFNPAPEAGVGVFSRVFGDVSLRADVRQRFNFDNDTIGGETRLDDTVASLGFAIPLGAAPERPQPVAQAEPAPVPAAQPAPQPVKETVILEGVNFCFDCHYLSDAAKAILDTNARKVIDANVDNPIELAGHTDSIGTEEYNQQLSQRRVDSVREYLVAQGVDGSKLTARGYGESQPIADNSTAQGRARNRRVEVRVME